MARSSAITHPKQPISKWESALGETFVEDSYTLVELMAYSGGSWVPVAYFTDLKVATKPAKYTLGSSSVSVTQVGVYPLKDASIKQEFSFTSKNSKIGTLDFSFNVPWFVDLTPQSDVNAVYSMLNNSLMAADSLTKSVPFAFSVKSGFAVYTGTGSIRDAAGQYALGVSDWSQEYDLAFPYLMTSVSYDRLMHVFTVECEDSMGWFSRIDSSKLLMDSSGNVYSENNPFTATSNSTWSTQYWYASQSWMQSRRETFTRYAMSGLATALGLKGGTYLDSSALNQACSYSYLDAGNFTVSPLTKETSRSILDLIYSMAMVQRMRVLPAKQTSYTSAQYILLQGDTISPISYNVYRGHEKKDAVIKPISETLGITSSSYFLPEVKGVYSASTFAHLRATYSQLVNGAVFFTSENLHCFGVWSGTGQTQTVTCKLYRNDADFTKVVYNTEFNITSQYDLGLIETYSDQEVTGGHRPVTVRGYCLGSHCFYLPPQGPYLNFNDVYSFSNGTGTRYDLTANDVMIEVPIMTFTETKLNYQTGGAASQSGIGAYYTAADDDTGKTAAITNHLCVNAAEANECQRNASGAPYYPKEKISVTCRNDPSLAVGNIVNVAYYDKYVQTLITSIDRSLCSTQEAKLEGWVLSYTSADTMDLAPTNRKLSMLVVGGDRINIYAAGSWTSSSDAVLANVAMFYDLIQEIVTSDGTVVSRSTICSTQGTTCTVALAEISAYDRFYLRAYGYGFDKTYQLDWDWGNFQYQSESWRYSGMFAANEERYC